jgi:DNA-binding NarL/FixJ family response regulator
MDVVHVLIADDHALYREGIRAMLRDVPGVEVVGEAATGEDVIVKACQLQPDVILMDIKMPGMNGIEATRHILRDSPHMAILIVTMFDDDDSVFAAMCAGARGYVLKDAEFDELVRAIIVVAHGEAIFGPSIAQRMMSYFASPRPSAPPHVLPDLTEREREILGLMAAGRSNEEIAEQLVLRLKTVQNHISNIFTKLAVNTRVQAILRAQAAGLG